MKSFTTSLLLVLLLIGCKPKGKDLSYELIKTHPHDVACYTQGLEFDGDDLLESGGKYGESSVRRVNPQTGEVLQSRKIPGLMFAEGLTVLNGELWLLTWKEKIALVFDPKTFELLRRHSYEGEGWGITHDGSRLIMSNGSSTLSIRDAKDFKVIEVIQVTRDGRPLEGINELEYVDGEIFANIYTKDEIVRIDAESGRVTGVVNLSALRGLLTQREIVAEELNGIAYDRKTGHLWVTGKHWSQVFEIVVKP